MIKHHQKLSDIKFYTQLIFTIVILVSLVVIAYKIVSKPSVIINKYVFDTDTEIMGYCKADNSCVHFDPPIKAEGGTSVILIDKGNISGLRK